MNEEIQKQVSDLLKEGKDFVVEQAPQAVQQYLQIEALDYVGWMTVLSIFFVLCMAFFYKMNKAPRDNLYDETYTFRWVPLCFGALFLCFVVGNIFNYFEVTYFPKGYLLKQMHVCGSCCK